MNLHSAFVAILVVVLCSISASAQKVERLYNISSSDTASNYTSIIRPKGKVTGLVVLFPGFGETPADVLSETDFPIQAAQAGLLVAIPYIGNNAIIMLAPEKQQQLVQLVQDVQKRYKLQKNKVAIGGFSMGGTTAVKLAETILSSSAGKSSPEVAALFAVDPLLDMERFERDLVKAVKRNASPMAARQLQMLQTYLKQDFGSTPLQHPEKFYTVSPYTYSDTANTAIEPLSQLPVLFYSEPDVATQFNSNSRDLYNLNTLDCAAMINDLRSMGNKQAQLILTEEKGIRRSNNKPNPHSWSILDSRQTISWLQQHLN